MKKFLLSIIAIFMTFVLVSAPVYAEKCTLTSILGNATCDKDGNRQDNGEYNCSCDSEGESINNTLKTIVDIMSIGVGILGVIGISIVGIQYLTAGGNEEQTRKAKRRIYEIIIGLAVYALIYALLQFFLPGFSGI